MDELREEAHSLMGFGKHCELTYLQALRRHPDYFRWARQKEKDEGVSGPLADWLTWAKEWRRHANNDMHSDHDSESNSEEDFEGGSDDDSDSDDGSETDDSGVDSSDSESDSDDDSEEEEEEEETVEVLGVRTREERDAALRAAAVDVEAATTTVNVKREMKVKREDEEEPLRAPAEASTPPRCSSRKRAALPVKGDDSLSQAEREAHLERAAQKAGRSGVKRVKTE